MYFVKIDKKLQGKRGTYRFPPWNQLHLCQKCSQRNEKSSFSSFFLVLATFYVFFKTVESYTKLNALNPTFNFLLRKFTLNSLLGKNSVFQNHFIGNKASEINKNFFLYFLLKLCLLFCFICYLKILNWKTTVSR